MSDGLIEFGGGQEAPPGLGVPKADSFKGSTGKRYLISFVGLVKGEDGRLDLNAKMPKMIAGKQVYIKGVGKVISKGPEFVALSDKKEETFKITTVVAAWPLTSEDQIDYNAIKAGKYIVQPWTFTEKRFSTLKGYWSRFAPFKSSMDMTCTDEKFQNFDIICIPESPVLRMLTEDEFKPLFKELVARVEKVTARLPKEIGNNFSIEEVRNKLNQKGAGGSVEQVTPSYDMGNVQADLDGLM